MLLWVNVHAIGIFTEKEKLLLAPTVSRNLIYTEVEANQDFSAVVSDIVEKLMVAIDSYNCKCKLHGNS